MKYVPRNKLSKKAKRQEDLKHRKVWGISPVTRKPPNPKIYKRKKNVNEDVSDE